MFWCSAGLQWFNGAVLVCSGLMVQCWSAVVWCSAGLATGLLMDQGEECMCSVDLFANQF